MATVAPFRMLVLASLGLGILPLGGPGSHVRRGNAAYAQKDFGAALSAYDQAQGTTLDPGLVAFNKAATLYAHQQFGLAALEYQRCLEDAATWRRWQALYGLGNALTQDGFMLKGRSAVATLTKALDAYGRCVRELENEDAALSESLLGDAQHNLRIAEKLLAMKQAEAAQEPPNLDSSQSPETPGAAQGEDQGQPSKSGNNQPGPRNHENKSTSADAQPNTDNQTGGKGNLPPLPDAADAPALNAADALEYLQQALERMRQDRLRQGTATTGNHRARDW